MTAAQDLYSEVQDAVVELFTLDATVRGQGVLRFCAGSNAMGQAVLFNGNTFTALPITGDGWARTTGDSAPRPTITISNVNAVVQALVYSAGDLSGSQLTRQRIYSKYLDAGNFPRWNMLNYSQAFDNAAWVTSNVSVTANATTAPDGTTTADKIVENTTTSVSHSVREAITLTSGTTYTMTCYMKAAGRTQGRLELPSSAFGGTTTGSYFDLSSVTVSKFGAATTATITSVGSGWYCCTVTATATATASSSAVVYPASGFSAIYTGDGVSGIYVWGAQVEVGAAFTTYQLTTNTHWFTSDPTQVLSTDVYIVDRMVTMDKVSAQFELCWQLDRPGVRLPYRKALRDFGFPGLGLNAT